MINGMLVKELREKKGLSQEQLSKACGYSDKSAISRIENGLYTDIPLSKAIKIAKELGITPTALIK